MATYVIGAGLLATSRYAPLVLDLGLWGVGKVAQGLYWVAWGRHESAEEEARLRRIIRDELLSSEARKDVPDDAGVEHG
jgi:hypothetical protein